MANRPRHKRHAEPLPATSARVEKALREGRAQQALELARTLNKQEPTPAHGELLRRATLERARQLRTGGYVKDAATTLQNAENLGGDAAYLEQVAIELALCGHAGHALRLAEKFPGTPAAAKIVAHGADRVVQEGPAAREKFPEALRPQLDLVLQAFAHVEQGKDEEARTALQGIGLQSPFMEWKLLLRGLLAYYANDDARAIENWQRLSADRLPARLAAPLRFLIDRPFAATQPPETQNALRKQSDALQATDFVGDLRSLQLDLANEQRLPDAFRKGERIVKAVREQAPHLLPRVAACYYWAIIDHGYPEDVNRYRRLFGAPKDDPKLARMNALAVDRRQLHHDAHKYWQEFEKSVAADPSAWPAGQADRVRALVWRHLAENAASMPDLEGLKDLGGPFRALRGTQFEPLKPNVEECYKRSLDLAPDQLDTHFALFEYLNEKDKAGKAEAAARKLLKRFPEHAPTLEGLADLLMEKEEYGEALSLFERALKANPLERRLRWKLALAVMYESRSRAEAGDFDAARAGYQRALAMEESGKKYPVLCKWAATEFKAGEAARAEELLAQAHAEGGNRLAVAFSMLVEVVRFKLPRPLKARFDAEVKECLAEPPTGAAAAAIAETMSSLRRAGVKYHGQGAHEKKVLDYLKKAAGAEFTVQEMLRTCAALDGLQKPRLLNEYFRAARRRFPQDPGFLLLEAGANLQQGPGRCNVYETRRLLEQARKLIEPMPHAPHKEALLKQVDGMQEALDRLNPFAAMFEGGFMDPFGFFGDDDEDDADDYY